MYDQTVFFVSAHSIVLLPLIDKRKTPAGLSTERQEVHAAFRSRHRTHTHTPVDLLLGVLGRLRLCHLLGSALRGLDLLVIVTEEVIIVIIVILVHLRRGCRLRRRTQKGKSPYNHKSQHQVIYPFWYYKIIYCLERRLAHKMRRA